MLFARFIRFFFLVFSVALLGACASAVEPPARPRLVVFFVVDGLPQRQVLAYRDQLAPDGFARFLDRGTWFANAHHRHAFTVTAAGHATLASGAYPHRTGIIGNDWLDAATGRQVYNTEDTRYTYLGHATQANNGTSPKNLFVDTVGDALKRASPASKVVAVSGKDRGAILPAGHAGVAYMYMDSSGRFASSSYYMAAHPEWVERFNAEGRAARYFGTSWKPLLPEAAYAGSVPDAQPWFRNESARLPMQMGAGMDGPGPRFYQSLLGSPFVDQMTLDFARAAIEGERLGQREVPDLLLVSLSGHDYVNHAYSAESRLSHDHFLQLDRMLQSFFADLDRRVGAGNYVALLSADHGFTPAPEVSAAQGKSAGRISGTKLVSDVNDALVQRFGAGRWVLGFSAGGLLLDRKLAAQRGIARDALAEAARDALLKNPGIEVAYTAGEIQSRSRAGQPWFDAVEKTWHPARSGDVQFVMRRYWIAGSRGSTHGSPHEEDSHVPLLWWGPHWVGEGRADAPVQTVDVAPTLAAMLGIAAPSASEGRALPLLQPALRR